MKTKVLIAGMGSIGMRHARNLLTLGYRNLALCDPSRKRLSASSALGRFNRYADLSVALDKERPDIALICNPTHLHVPSAMLALNFGAHVFIEKPISHSLRGIDALRKKAMKKKKVVMVACNFRFSKGFQKLEEVLQKVTFGTPLLARVVAGYYLPTARKGVSHKTIYAAGTQGGGVLLDSGSHAVDYLMELFGSIKKRVAFKSPLHTIGIKSEEAAIVLLRHANGILSSVALDFVSRKPTHRIEIVTDAGVLTLDMRKDRLVYEDDKTKEVLYVGNGNLNSMFCEELKHFLNCAKNGLRPKQDISMAKETLKTLLMASL